MKSSTNIYIVLGSSVVPFLISVGLFVSGHTGLGFLFLAIAVGLAVFGIIRSAGNR
jgi:hypothetical protein